MLDKMSNGLLAAVSVIAIFMVISVGCQLPTETWRPKPSLRPDKVWEFQETPTTPELKEYPVESIIV
jgi:hypothetical protein